MTRSHKKTRYKVSPPDNIDQAVGRMIKAIRIHRDVTCETVAKWIGIDEDQYRLRETGHGAFSASELYKLASTFDIPVDALYSFLYFETSDMGAFLNYIQCERLITNSLHVFKTPEDALRFTKDIRADIQKILNDRESDALTQDELVRL